MRLSLTALVTAAALAATGGTAIAAGDDPLSYSKSSTTENQACAAALSTDGHWTADLNPSQANEFIRDFCEQRGGLPPARRGPAAPPT